MMSIFIYILNKVRNVLTFLRGKTFLTFLFFLGLSTAFWFFEVSKETKSTELTFPLRLVNIPENVVVTTELPSHVRVRVKAENSTLFYYRFLRTMNPAMVDFANYANASSHVNVPQEDVLRSIRRNLKPDTEILSLMPDTLEYYYSFGAKKEIPIQFQGKIQTAEGYYICSQTITPASTTVFATEQMLDSMMYAFTEPTYLENINKNGNLLLNLQKLKGVKIIPDTARIAYVVDRLVEKTLSLPIETVNFPDNQRLRTFPMQTNVTFQVGTRNYRDITAEDFKLVVDYNQLNMAPNAKTCHLMLQQQPDNVFAVRLQQSEVEYLIEEITEP